MVTVIKLIVNVAPNHIHQVINNSHTAGVGVGGGGWEEWGGVGEWGGVRSGGSWGELGE